MDYVIKVELPEGHELHNQCRYYRQEGSQFTDEFERATRFETLEEVNGAMLECRAHAVLQFGSGDPFDRIRRLIKKGDTTSVKCSIVCC
jgi:hypothetical protein